MFARAIKTRRRSSTVSLEGRKSSLNQESCAADRRTRPPGSLPPVHLTDSAINNRCCSARPRARLRERADIALWFSFCFSTALFSLYWPIRNTPTHHSLVRRFYCVQRAYKKWPPATFPFVLFAFELPAGSKEGRKKNTARGALINAAISATRGAI